MKRAELKSFMLSAVVIASFGTYLSSDGKLIGYAVAVIAMMFTTVAIGFGLRGSRSLFFLCCTFFLVVSISLLSNATDLQELPVEMYMYPVVFLMIAGCIWRIFFLERGGAILLLWLFVVNAGVAVLGSLGVDSLPVFGEISTGRAIFMTSVPSSAGLVWNVNYYAATQAVGFWLLFSLLKAGRIPRAYSILIYLVAASVILGSSRSCTVALLISMAFYFFLQSGVVGRSGWLIGIGLLASSLVSIYYFALNDQELNSGLRLYKGFNNRDDLWMIALELARERPISGYGSADAVRQNILLMGASNSTAQNSLLTMQLLFGAGGALLFLWGSAMAFHNLAVWRRRGPQTSAIAALLLFCLIDSLVRTYILGGIGFIPLMMAAAIVYLMQGAKTDHGRVGANGAY